MKPFQRIFVLVLDGFGVGAQADAKSFGDEGAHTLESVLRAKPQLQIPHLTQMGLLHCCRMKTPVKLVPEARYTKMIERSAGKDTTTGHWEMMGLPVQKAFDTFPNGFPEDLLKRFCQEAEVDGTLGNKTASGTAIIEELGEEHLRTGFPIIYTSADSVFQIAAHEEHFGLDRLYEVCLKTRTLLNQSDYSIGRVIARPFVGSKAGNFQRTPRRQDFSLKPFDETALTKLKAAKLPVIGVGKIPSIYDHEGFTEEVKSQSDEEGLRASIELLQQRPNQGLIFTNLNDLDMLYGHRRNPEGYGTQLEMIDAHLPDLQKNLGPDDLLAICSDHGNDPAFKGTDHTREEVPLLFYSSRWKADSGQAQELSTRQSFCDLGQSIVENFGLKSLKHGSNIFE